MKIFLSSTIYDLDDLRDSLKNALEEDAHEVITSQHGSIPIDSTKHSYQICIDNAAACDCLIGIVWSRLGGWIDENEKTITKRNMSITQAEIEAALESEKRPHVFVFVRRSVWDAKEVYRTYAKASHPFLKTKLVEDERILDMVDVIRARKTGNWILRFNDAEDILRQVRSQIAKSGKASWYDRILDYTYSRGSANSRIIRLVGAADELFSRNEVQVDVSNIPYSLPEEFRPNQDDIIRNLRALAEVNNAPFFNGPHTRLVDLKITQERLSEQKHLTLTLGPLDWYDYLVTQHYIDNAPKIVQPLIDLEMIARSGNVKNRSSLHNILDTATTVLTRDGVLLYSRRNRVAVDTKAFTSAIAENTHQVKDRSLIPDTADELWPAPFCAVIRGIEEELSPHIAELIRIGEARLYCTGMSFNLDGYHPDMLFIVVLPMSWTEARHTCREKPGKDFSEGAIVSADIAGGDMRQLDTDLTHGLWTGGGKASVLRALELVETLSARHHISKIGVIDSLRTGQFPVSLH